MAKRRDWQKIAGAVEKIKELELSYRAGAEQFGIKVRDIYEYNRLKGRGISDLEGPTATDSPQERSSTLPAELQQLILDYRREHPDHGFKRIADCLKTRHLVVVSRKQIRQALKEKGLLETLDSSFDRPPDAGKGERRFEASYPGDLYQMDVTYVYISGISVLYLVVIVDDHSRFCVAADLCRDQRGDTLIEVLHNACARHGKPRKLLTDQGSGFYTWSREETAFQKYLDEQQIEHIVSDPHSPQTQGKVERLIQTIKKELLGQVRYTGYADARQGILDYVKSYNFDRPHQGIKGVRPADRFYGVAGETSRIEAELAGRELDFSKGYLVFKVQNHSLSVICSAEGLQVFLDGAQLKEGGRSCQ